MMKNLFFCIVFASLSLFAFAAGQTASASGQGSGHESLPMGYGNIKLGMSVDEVKSELLKNHAFGYRGDRDVSFSPKDNQVLIETDGRYAPFSYFGRCWFQFADGKLYIITINLNEEKVDHYSVFTSLNEKYGAPDQLTPKKSQWKNDNVMMSLERPLSLKYIDAKAFTERMDKANVEKTYGEQNREEFLKGL